MTDSYLTWLPGLTRRRAASAHKWAALITSAFRPVMRFSYRNEKAQKQDFKVFSNKQPKLCRNGKVIKQQGSYLSRPHNKAVSNIGNEAINMNPKVTAENDKEKERSKRWKQDEPRLPNSCSEYVSTV